MNVTREVVTDLLPIYFSGEASAETHALVEEFFRQDPEFERIARSAAKPLESLRVAAWPGVLSRSPEAEREKRGLEDVRYELHRRKWWFALALFCTFIPLAFVYSHGQFTWVMARNRPWDAVIYWSVAALFWFFYFARLRRRTTLFIAAIFITLLPINFAVNFFDMNWPKLSDNLGELAVVCIGSLLCWMSYFRARRRDRA